MLFLMILKVWSLVMPVMGNKEAQGRNFRERWSSIFLRFRGIPFPSFALPYAQGVCPLFDLAGVLFTCMCVRAYVHARVCVFVCVFVFVVLFLLVCSRVPPVRLFQYVCALIFY